jgi:hypothetical protein
LRSLTAAARNRSQIESPGKVSSLRHKSRSQSSELFLTAPYKSWKERKRAKNAQASATYAERTRGGIRFIFKKKKETELKAKSKTTDYVVNCIAATVLMLTAQISLAGSATWLLSPQDSAWENANNWTPGGPPNGPSDIATFAQSSQADVNISTSQEVNSIVFTSESASFNFSVLGCSEVSCEGAELIISGTGITNSSVRSRTS